MVFSSENERPRDNSQFDSNAIKSTLYGGLNVASSALSIPTQDSPDLDNIRISDEGNIGSRDGTISVHVGNYANQLGLIMLPYESRTNKNLLFIKNGRSVDIHYKSSGNYGLVLTKANIWPDTVVNLKPDYVITNEAFPRIIFTLAEAAPVQLTLVEASQIVASAGTSQITISFPTLGLSNTSFPTNVDFSREAVLFINGVPYPVQTFNAGTGLVTLYENAPAGNVIVDVIRINWQWWAPGIHLRGAETINVNQRFHATFADASVAVPVELLKDIEDTAPPAGHYPIILYKSAGSGAQYNYVPYTPTGVDDWTFSFGATNSAGVTEVIQPDISHVTFGDPGLGTPTAIETIHFVRGYPLFDGVQMVGTQLYVEVGGVEWTQENPVAPLDAVKNYRLRDVPASGFHTARGDFTGTHITFDGTTQLVQPGASDVFIVRKAVPVGVSNTALTTVVVDGETILPDGYPYTVFGLHEHCDYVTGSYPRAIAFYNNRIALAGFPQQPTKVVLSSVADTRLPGRFFDHYQIALDAEYFGSAIAFYVNEELSRGKPIVAMSEFADNLFIFTTVSGVRVRGSGTGNISPTELTIISLGALGAHNAKCVTKGENMLVFFGPQGVTTISPIAEINGFRTTQISFKIKELLTDGKYSKYNNSVAWLAYSISKDRLVIGVSDTDNYTNASYLFLYSFVYEAWTRYTTLARVFPTIAGVYASTDDVIDELVVASTAYHYNNIIADTSVKYLTFDFYLALDFVKNLIASGSTTVFTVGDAYEVTHTTTRLIRRYTTSILKSGQATGFKMNKDLSVEDVRVTLDGVLVPFGVGGFHKISNDTIYLEYPMNDGQTLLIQLATKDDQDRTVYPIDVVVDNIILLPNEDYIVSIVGGEYQAALLFTPPDNANISLGIHQHAYWTTPIFNRQTLFSKKRLRDVAVLVKNYVDLWTELDVNTSSSQALDSLIGQLIRPSKIHATTLVAGETTELLGNELVYYDDALYDADSSPAQIEEYISLSAPLVGRLHTFQIMFWSTGHYRWQIVGYQVRASSAHRSKQRGRRTP